MSQPKELAGLCTTVVVMAPHLSSYKYNGRPTDWNLQQKRRDERDIIYILYVYRGITSVAVRMYYFSSYFILPSSVRTFARIICDFFFTGERPRLHRAGMAARWRSGCTSHRVHRPARATERAPPLLICAWRGRQACGRTARQGRFASRPEG